MSFFVIDFAKITNTSSCKQKFYKQRCVKTILCQFSTAVDGILFSFFAPLKSFIFHEPIVLNI